MVKSGRKERALGDGELGFELGIGLGFGLEFGVPGIGGIFGNFELSNALWF
jgi:hypothetical protein